MLLAWKEHPRIWSGILWATNPSSLTVAVSDQNPKSLTNQRHCNLCTRTKPALWISCHQRAILTNLRRPPALPTTTQASQCPTLICFKEVVLLCPGGFGCLVGLVFFFPLKATSFSVPGRKTVFRNEIKRAIAFSALPPRLPSPTCQELVL